MRLKLGITCFIFIVLFCGSSVFFQHKTAKKIAQLTKIASTRELETSNTYLFDHFVSMLKVYSAYDEYSQLELKRWGKKNDGGYVIPIKALESADMLLGYGIDEDNSFEDSFSLAYSKPSYGFDCGIDGIESKSELFHFVDQCIGNDKFLYDKYQSSGNISSFSTQLKKLGIASDSKLFIKMDIEGAEYDAFQDILNYSDQITGIVLEIHTETRQHTGDRLLLSRALELMVALEENFLLVHIHGNNCCVGTGFYSSNAIGRIPNVMELSYINKNLVSNYEISKNTTYPLSIDMPNIPNHPDASFKLLNAY